MDHAGHTVKNSAWQGGGFWKEIDGGDFGRELAGRRILSTFTKCGPRPTATLAAAKRGGIFKGIYSKGYPTSFSSWAFLSKFWDCISWTQEWIGGPPYFAPFFVCSSLLGNMAVYYGFHGMFSLNLPQILDQIRWRSRALPGHGPVTCDILCKLWAWGKCLACPTFGSGGWISASDF